MMNTLREIAFTQYLRPNGRAMEVSISRPVDIHEKAMKIINAGYCFEVEELRTGDVCMTISKDGIACDIEVVNNGPEVPKAVDRMINRFISQITCGETL